MVTNIYDAYKTTILFYEGNLIELNLFMAFIIERFSMYGIWLFKALFLILLILLMKNIYRLRKQYIYNLLYLVLFIYIGLTMYHIIGG